MYKNENIFKILQPWYGGYFNADVKKTKKANS